MKGGAMAVVGTSAIPAFLTRTVLAQATTAQAQGKKLVVIFQRGAADGLNIVVPHRENAYYQMRPTIAIQQNQVIDLDGFFGLHPAMQPLKSLWDQKHLAIVHACGSPDPSRSHFDAQDYMESGTPGIKATTDGWLNRALQAEDAAHVRQKQSAFRAVALGTQVPRTLEGRIPAIAINNVRDFSIGGSNPAATPIATSFEAMYADSVNAVLHGTGSETFEAVKMLQAADPAKYMPAPGANYPNGPFGNGLKTDCTVAEGESWRRGGFYGYWRVGHAPEPGKCHRPAGQSIKRDFSEGLTAFWTDMGDQGERHRLSCLDVGIWPDGSPERHRRHRPWTCQRHVHSWRQRSGRAGLRQVARQLRQEQLYEGRDLAVTTDFRQVLGEAAYKTVGARNLDLVFPEAGLQTNHFQNILKV